MLFTIFLYVMLILLTIELSFSFTLSKNSSSGRWPMAVFVVDLQVGYLLLLPSNSGSVLKMSKETSFSTLWPKHLRMGALQKICEGLGSPTDGTRRELVDRIMNIASVSNTTSSGISRICFTRSNIVPVCDQSTSHELKTYHQYVF